MSNNTGIRSKTEPWELEGNMVVAYVATQISDSWNITVGSAHMPKYVITGNTLTEAIIRLVREVTRDAIEDEALQWADPN